MDDSQHQKVVDHIAATMPELERPASGRIPHPWLSVGNGRQYAGSIYTWDHHHAAMRFATAGAPQYLRHLVDNLLAYQQHDGHTPSMISVERGPRFLDPPYHAQPFLLQGALMYVRQTDDRAWGRGVFDRLLKYLGFYETSYRAPHGMFRYHVGWQGGFDNDVVNTFFPPGTIVSAEINGWIYLEYLAGSRLASMLDRADDAGRLEQAADLLRERINDVLWYDQMESYAALNLCNDKPLFHLEASTLDRGVGQFAFQSCSNLIPLYARVATPDRARAMIERYVLGEDHFWSLFGIRSLSRSSEYCNNAKWGNPPRFGDHRRLTNSNWQGPVWIPINYFVFHALRHYGFADEARQLADRTMAVLDRSLDAQGSFAENFHSETGDPLYATDFASWNILADTMHGSLADDPWIMEVIFDAGE